MATTEIQVECSATNVNGTSAAISMIYILQKFNHDKDITYDIYRYGTVVSIEVLSVTSDLMNDDRWIVEYMCECSNCRENSTEIQWRLGTAEIKTDYG